MTISTEAIKSSVFAGNGSTVAFAITFKTFSQADLTVTLTSSAGVEAVKALTTHYTVSLNANQDNSPGGTVTMGTPPASGEKLVIANEPEYTQSSDIVNGGGFFPNVIEDMVDRNTILSRRAQEQTSRSIQIPISDSTGTTVKLPTETLRASKAVVFDSSGNVGVSTDNYVDQVATVAASATAAASSASAASSSATASASSATASAASAAAAATSYDNFDDRFLGAKSSDPSTDNDSDALITGALYFNSSNNVMMAYTGSAWVRTTPTSGDQTNINTLSASAVVTDMDLLGTSANVAAMALLGTSDAVSDLNTLGTSDIVTDMNTLATSANVTAMGHLGTSANVTAMGLLGTSAVVTDLGILGTADVVSDLNTLGAADVVTDLNTLGTSDVVSDMNTLATSANVTAMGVLGTSANVTAMSNCSGSIANVNTTATNIANVNLVGSNITTVNTFSERYRVASSEPSASLNQGDLYFNTATNEMSSYGTSWQPVAISAANQANINICAGDIVFTEDLGSIVDAVTTSTGSDISTVADSITEINRLGTAAAVEDLSILGTADVVSDLNTLGTADVVSDLNTLATGANVTAMNTLGTSANVTAMSNVSGSIASVNTVSASIADVNRYANEYTIASSAPAGPSAGDLWMDTTANVLKYYTGSTFSGIISGITDIVADASPQLGGALDCQNNNVSNCGTIDGTNLQMDFGSIA